MGAQWEDRGEERGALDDRTVSACARRDPGNSASCIRRCVSGSIGAVDRTRIDNASPFATASAGSRATARPERYTGARVEIAHGGDGNDQTFPRRAPARRGWGRNRGWGFSNWATLPANGQALNGFTMGSTPIDAAVSFAAAGALMLFGLVIVLRGGAISRGMGFRALFW